MPPATNALEYASQRFCAAAPYLAGGSAAYAIVTGSVLPLSGIAMVAIAAAAQGCGLQPPANNSMYPYYSPVQGGQCANVGYTIFITRNGVEEPAAGIVGPFQYDGLQSNGLSFWHQYSKNGVVQLQIGAYRPDLGQAPTTQRFARNDGLPDNCGGGGLVQPTTPAPYPAPTTINNNYYAPEITIDVQLSPTLVVPIVAPPLLIPMPYPLPIVIPTPFGPSVVKPDGSVDLCDPCCVNPSDYFPKDEQECPPVPELISVALPIGTCNEGEGEVTTKTVRVVAGDLTNDDLDAIASGASAVASACGGDEAPEQKPKAMIGSGVSSNTVQLFYVTPEAEVQTVLLVITGSSSESNLRGSAYAGASQKAYGAIGWSFSDEPDCGGSEEYVYSKRHYYKLPKGPKGGKVKLLLKPGTAWQLFDTGER